MKKTALILLVLAYAASVFGVGLKEFYCCGKFVSKSLQYGPAVSKQDCGMSSQDKGCCKTRVHFHKVGDIHGAASAINAVEKAFCYPAVLPHLIVVGNVLKSAASKSTNNPHAPPLCKTVPVYKFNCNFRL